MKNFFCAVWVTYSYNIQTIFASYGNITAIMYQFCCNKNS